MLAGQHKSLYNLGEFEDHVPKKSHTFRCRHCDGSRLFGSPGLRGSGSSSLERRQQFRLLGIEQFVQRQLGKQLRRMLGWVASTPTSPQSPPPRTLAFQRLLGFEQFVFRLLGKPQPLQWFERRMGAGRSCHTRRARRKWRAECQLS